jgi:hypothetical protein
MAAEASQGNQAETKLDLISNADIPEQFAFGTTLQTYLEKLSDETFEEIFEFLCQNKAKIFESFEIIFNFFHFRPHQSSLILDLIQKISEISPFPFNLGHFIDIYPFLAYKLIERGVISRENALKYLSKSNLFKFLIFHEKIISWDVPNCFRELFEKKKHLFPIDEIRQFGYPKNSIEYFLKADNFDELQRFSTFADFNFSATTFISPCDLLYGIELENKSLLSVSAFYGSVQCFKFLLLNFVEVTSSVCASAVKCGDLEIIQICEQEHGDFSGCLQPSVAYHRNDVADWLLQNFTVNRFTYEDCIKSLNFPALAYLHAKRGEISHQGGTDLEFSAW